MAAKGGPFKAVAATALLSLALWGVSSAGAATGPAQGSFAQTCANWRGLWAPRVVGTIGGLAGTSADDVWALGSAGAGTPTIIMHWDGAAWGQVAHEDMTGAPAAAVSISSTDAWGIGADKANVPFSMHWDGSIWRKVGISTVGTFDYLLSVTAVSSTDVWAAGDFTGSQGIHPLVEHWDGATWTQVFAPDGVQNSTNAFYGIAAVSADDIWAAGYEIQSGPSDIQPLIEHWDGFAWSVVDSPLLGGDNNILYGVSATSSTDVTAVGVLEDRFAGTTAPLIEHWDGTAWSVVPVPEIVGKALLIGVSAVSASDAWAVGEQIPDTAEQSLVMHWDGTQWSNIPSPTPGSAGALSDVAAITTHDIWATGGYYDPSFHADRPLTMRSKGCRSA